YGADAGLRCELASGHFNNLLIREDREGTLEEGMLLICLSPNPEVHSACARECYPFDFPFPKVAMSMSKYPWRPGTGLLAFKPPPTLTMPSIPCFSPIFRRSSVEVASAGSMTTR